MITAAAANSAMVSFSGRLPSYLCHRTPPRDFTHHRCPDPITGPRKYENVGKYQSVLIMINLIMIPVHAKTVAPNTTKFHSGAPRVR
jgi:hypothetical protein